LKIKKPAFPKRSRPVYGLKNTNMALTSYFLERRPHHGSHIVFVFCIMFLKYAVKK
jgi:hypothetical protein